MLGLSCATVQRGVAQMGAPGQREQELPGVAGPLAAWQISVLIGWCSAATTFGGVALSMIVGADSERGRLTDDGVDGERDREDLL